MNNHSAFYFPQMMKRTGMKEYNFVAYDLKEGDEVLCGQDNDGREIRKIVNSIVEMRLSKGEFNNHNRPNFYSILVR